MTEGNVTKNITKKINISKKSAQKNLKDLTLWLRLRDKCKLLSWYNSKLKNQSYLYIF